jgi:TonB family protein
MLLDAQDGKRGIGPSPTSLTSSVGLHVLLVGWMFFGPSLSGTRPPEPQKNIYQQLIEPNEKKLVWYNFKDKLPQVSPLQRHGPSRPPRTDRKTDRQTIVANPRNPGKSKQMVYLPAPPRQLDHEVPAPNLFAFAVPKLPPPEAKPAAKLFAPPPEVMKAITPPEPLADAPDVAAATAKVELPQPDALPKPPAKQFVPPVEAKRGAASDPAVPDAPKIAANSAKPALPQRQFVPPPEQKRAASSDPAVPDAPQVATASARQNLPQPDALPKPQPKKFVPPPEQRRAARPDPGVPDAPVIAANAPKAKLPQRQFIPPPERRRGTRPDPTVPDAPKVGPASARLTLPQPDALPKPQPKTFVGPRESKRASGPDPVVPDAPRVGGATARVDLPQAGALPKPQPRTFVPPREARRTPGTAPSMPDAPAAVGATTARIELPQTGALPRPQPRAFHSPESKPSAGISASAAGVPGIEAAPELDTQAGTASLTAAIVGLKPADQLVELPDAAQSAQFSSGPKRMEDGGTGEPVETAKIFVPDLMIRDGAIAEPSATMMKKFVKAAAAPTSAENVSEAAHSAPLLRSEVRLPGVAQVPNAPDPRLNGRIIYMVAIQMPNVTSYIGSWTMWFADREPMPGQVREMRPPVPTRKVDPKYVASAAAERVEGKVQLSAVIRRDGHVESVSVLQHLDDRLDFSATQALQKWEFTPAKRDGQTVDVDAIFEIPFRLEPLAKK